MKKIGLLFGMEDTFPWALINEINARGGEEVGASPVAISYVQDTGEIGYDLVLDRISHEVPFYRTWLKCAMARGTVVVNNPFWWSADDKFFDNLVAERAGVAVPKTILLPHKQYPPNTEARSFRNLEWVNWEEVFSYLGFPIFLKPAYGGGWKDVYKCDTPQELFAAYDQTRDLTMMAQEAIDFTEYYRCYVLGRSRVRIMQYDPKKPFHERYVRNDVPADTPIIQRIHRDAITLCEILGYDMNTVEFAVRDGIPYAIDFMNCAPDADLHSVGEENFKWVVNTMAEVLIELVTGPARFEPTGSWPRVMGLNTEVGGEPVAASASLQAAAESPAPAPAAPAAAAKPKKTSSARTSSTAKSAKGAGKAGKKAPAPRRSPGTDPRETRPGR
jgi:glutathione synthase/RimK-type ligase-like ATP-grasp enzyme